MAATAVRRLRRCLGCQKELRWTVRATSTSPTGATIASARWTRREPSRQSSRPQLFTSLGVWRWMETATSTSQSFLASARWTPPRTTSQRSRQRAATASGWMACRRPRRCLALLSGWRWTVRATSTSPTWAATASARWTHREPSRRSRAPAHRASAAPAFRRLRRC